VLDFYAYSIAVLRMWMPDGTKQFVKNRTLVWRFLSLILGSGNEMPDPSQHHPAASEFSYHNLRKMMLEELQRRCSSRNFNSGLHQPRFLEPRRFRHFMRLPASD